MTTDQNCISYWFPKLQEVIPEAVPKTMITRTSSKLWELLDGQKPDGYDSLISNLTHAGNVLGYPCFLRTGHTSGKHNWTKTCAVPNAERFPSHVAGLVEFSECCSFAGLPYDVWAVREWLHGEILAGCPYFGDMPVREEYRVFVRDGRIECSHNYWPINALVQGGALEQDIERYSKRTVSELPEDAKAIVLRAASAFEGYWSMDVLWTDRGWFVTDMALGKDSWHWEGCEHAMEAMLELRR